MMKSYSLKFPNLMMTVVKNLDELGELHQIKNILIQYELQLLYWCYQLVGQWYQFQHITRLVDSYDQGLKFRFESNQKFESYRSSGRPIPNQPRTGRRGSGEASYRQKRQQMTVEKLLPPLEASNQVSICINRNSSCSRNKCLLLLYSGRNRTVSFCFSPVPTGMYWSDGGLVHTVGPKFRTLVMVMWKLKSI